MKRNLLRQKAKKAYKEAGKNVPKNQRMPFSQFFKQYIKSHKHADEDTPETQEDFDLEDLISVNDITDDDEEETE